MTPYWLLLIIPSVISAFNAAPQASGRAKFDLGWVIVTFALIVMIGFRHEVGGDWSSYLRHYISYGIGSLPDVLDRNDPGYALLNWLSYRLEWGVYGVNTFCGVFFAIGLVAFCRRQPYPWLCLVVAVPYLVIVVGMGYSRQAVAIGWVLLAFTRAGEGRVVHAIAFALVASLFHRSAIIVLPLIVLSSTQNRWLLVAAGASFIPILYNLYFNDDADLIYNNYFLAARDSEGAGIRVAMNFVPAIVLLTVGNRIPHRAGERKLWWWIGVAGAAAPIALYLSPSSTVVDRVSLYLIPLQLFVFSRIPLLWYHKDKPVIYVVSVCAYSSTILYVWINFSSHAKAWLPYVSYLFMT